MRTHFLLRSFLLPAVIAITGASRMVGAQTPNPAPSEMGARTQGGRGGKVLRVTSLEASGSGSLAEALRTRGPRIIVFEVGGVIDLKGKNLNLTEPHVTLAGQTAPPPGITLIKGGLVVETHDAIIQHLAIRPGEAGRPKKSGWNADGITTVSATNVLFDHCSCTWATDENLSASGPRFEGASVKDWQEKTSHHITLSYCLIAECLSQSTHSKGEHSKGTLLHDNVTGILLRGNLYASNMERNPLAKGGAQALIVNNWISNPGRNAIHAALAPDEWKGHDWQPNRLTMVGNLLEHGHDTAAYVALFTRYAKTPVQAVMQDNLAFDKGGSPAPLLRGEPFKLEAAKLAWPEGDTPLAAADVKAHLARNVGARPWDRDPIDARIVDAALKGTGRIINSEQEVGGYPSSKATEKPFDASEWNLETMEKKGQK